MQPRGHDTPSTVAIADATGFVFDGLGGAARQSPDDLPARLTAGFTWLHLQRDAPGNDARLDKAGLDGFVHAALVADETRPRCTFHGDGAVLILRGVNLNPGAEAEDMVSIRLWIEAARVISVGVRPLAAANELIAAIDRGQAPESTGGLVARLAIRLSDGAEPVVAALNERIDALEDAVSAPGIRGELADVRRAATQLRRYMVPQKDALTTLDMDEMGWLSQSARGRIREAAERVARLGEELDEIRDRAQIVQDQIIDARAEAMNRQMLVLSVAAAVFLPLGLITGLLGVNVAGIPGANWPPAFWVLCGFLLAVGAGLVWLFLRIGLLGRRD